MYGAADIVFFDETCILTAVKLTAQMIMSFSIGLMMVLLPTPVCISMFYFRFHIQESPPSSDLEEEEADLEEEEAELDAVFDRRGPGATRERGERGAVSLPFFILSVAVSCRSFSTRICIRLFCVHLTFLRWFRALSYVSPFVSSFSYFCSSDSHSGSRSNSSRGQVLLVLPKQPLVVALASRWL